MDQIAEKRFVHSLKKENPDYRLSESDWKRVCDINNSAYNTEKLRNEITERYSSQDKLFKYYQCLHPAQVRICVSDDWYITFVHHRTYIHIADFAFSDAKCSNLLSMLNIIQDIVEKQGNKRFTSFMRGSTSYRLIKIYEKRKKIKILGESPEMYADEQFYHVSFVLQ